MTFDNWVKVNPEAFSLKDILSKKKRYVVSNDARIFEYETFGFPASNYRIFENDEVICESTGKYGVLIESQKYSDFSSIDYVVFRGYRGKYTTRDGIVEIVKSQKTKLFSVPNYDINLDGEKVGEINLKTKTTVFSSKIPLIFIVFVSAQLYDFEARDND